MTDKKISELTALAGADMQATDEIIVARPGTANYSMTRQEFLNSSDALLQSSLTNVDAVQALADRSFATRAAAVTECAAMVARSETPPVGTVWTFDGLSIEYDGSTTAVPGFSGWKPAGDVYADHFGENTTPGTTGMMAAVRAALSYSKLVHFRGVDYRLEFSSTDGLSPQGNTVLKGPPGANLVFAPDAATYRNLINMSNDGLTLDGVGMTIDAPSGITVVFFLMQSSGLQLINGGVFDGGITDDGVSASHTSYLISHPDAGTQEGILAEGCEFKRFWRGFLKTNAATSTQRRIRILKNNIHDNYIAFATFNSPSGTCTDIKVNGNFGRDEGLIDRTVYGSTTTVIAFATCENFEAIGNSIVGADDLKEVIHIEEDCSNYLIAHNILEIYNRGIQVLDNNIVGTAYRPKRGRIVDNVITKLGTAKASGSYGINLVFDATTLPPAEATVVQGNTITGFEFGISADGEVSDALIVRGNYIEGCAIGLDENGSTTWEDNTTKDCDVDFDSARASVLTRHTFVNPTQMVNAASRPVLVLNPKWRFDVLSISAATSDHFNMGTLASGDRMVGELVYSVLAISSGASSTEHAVESFAADWDGTTLTTTANYSLQPGSISATPSVSSGVFRVSVFTSNTRDIQCEVALNGSMAIA